MHLWKSSQPKILMIKHSDYIDCLFFLLHKLVQSVKVELNNNNSPHMLHEYESVPNYDKLNNQTRLNTWMKLQSYKNENEKIC